MSSNTFKFGFDVMIEKGICPRPVKVTTWKDEASLDRCQEPLKYMADVLCGLSLLRLNPNLSCPVTSGKKKSDADFCETAWTALDPNFELWKRSRDRVSALHREVPKWSGKAITDFEKRFTTTLEAAFLPNGIDVRALCDLIDDVGALESHHRSPLIYNFGLQFSPAFTQRLHGLYSFLYNLRCLVALDHNAHVDDPSVEAVKVDSLTDYIPKADYVVSDALLYWRFTKLSHPFTHGKNSDVKVDNLFVEPMRKAFHAASHNACHLIENLPQPFLEKLGATDLEEALHLVQMDWLLGSEAGLLFRIREELFGLQSGYEKVFWHDLQGTPAKKAFNLSIGFKLHLKDFATSAA